MAYPEKRQESNELEQFERDGYTVLHQVVPISARRRLFETLVSLLLKYDDTFTSKEARVLNDRADFTDPLLNSHLLALRGRRPAYFGCVYDTIQLTIGMQQLLLQVDLVDAISAAIRTDPSVLAATGPMLRMDPPNDSRNSLDWHQDSSYYEQNLSGEHGFVVWMPLHRVGPSNGAILVCVGSHREGRVKTVHAASREGTSEQFRVPEDVISKYPVVQVEADAGDAVIFSMDLLHRSGVNSSSSIRFCAGIRLHKFMPNDFLPGKFLFKANEAVGRLSRHE